VVSKLAYDSNVKRLNSATVAALALTLAGLVFLAPAAPAQINGTPASVSSPNFGGHVNSAPGVPASITSVGPNGIQPTNPFFNPPTCCINPLFPVRPNPPVGQRHHHQRGRFFPAGGAVYVPYAYPVVGESDAGDAAADQPDEQRNQNEDYRGGPTIFDRHGSGQPARSYVDDFAHRPNRAESEAVPAAPGEEAPVADQPQTILVFKDGRQLEVQNYAVIGDTLYDLSPGRHHKIPVADLDLPSTAKQNDDRGIDFRLPPNPETTK
jgi:hypothetical protein